MENYIHRYSVSSVTLFTYSFELYVILFLSLSLCFLHQENVPEEERIPTMRENTYVRVCGHVRSFQGKKNVVAFNIAPVEDMNQLSCHLLSVIYAHAATNMVSGFSLLCVLFRDFVVVFVFSIL